MKDHGSALRGFCLLMILLLAAVDGAAATKRSKQKKAPPKPKNAVSVDYEHENFGNSFAPWSLASAEFSHRFDSGPLIGRINRARRFGQSGTQVEVDAYPHIGRGMYLYANAGKSQDRIFPRERFGLELYKNLPNAFETSVGFRQLNFASTKVTLFTGTVAKYSGNNYYVARPYISHGTAGTSFTGQFTARRYFATADDYVSLVATAGKSPTEDIAPDAVNRISSWNLRATAQRTLIRNLIGSARVGYRNEEIGPSRTRRGWMIGTGIQRRF
ncbi:MAG: hypothetical protein NVSMB68_05390 [Thermoanaerobaculia bacterium]